MRAACEGQWDLFDSTEPADHEEAKAICQTCPMALACASRVRDLLSTRYKGEFTYLQGTWAGKHYGNGRTPRGARAIGTCPTCGAEDGEACRSTRGTKVSNPHIARTGPSRQSCRGCGEDMPLDMPNRRYCSKECQAEGRRASWRRYQEKRPSREGEKALRPLEEAS